MSDIEKQLRAVMMADAKIWKHNAATEDRATGSEPTKIELTKKQSEAARMIREKVARLKNGNYRPRRILGTMRLVENRDKLCSPTVLCEWCGEPFSHITRGKRAPALFCSAKCSHSAWRARRRAANG